VASTLALVMLVIWRESSPTTCMRQLRVSGCGTWPTLRSPLVKVWLPSRAFDEQNGLLGHVDRHFRHYDMSGGMHTGSTNVDIGRPRVRTV